MSIEDKYSLTEGGIIKKLLLIAIPIMGNQFLQMAYNLTDMFWLGKLGSEAVAASGAAGMFMWLSFGFMLIGRMGAEIGISQSLGRGDKKAALAYFHNAFIIAAVLGVFYALCMIVFRRELIGFFRFRETGVTENGVTYLLIVSTMMPLSFVGIVVGGAFQAAGNSRTPFIMVAIGVLTNVILDPVFIIVLGMGVRGAALATILSQFFSFFVNMGAIFLLRIKPFEGFSFRLRFDKEKIVQIFKWAVPIGLENIFFCFLSMVTSRIEAGFGANAVAASRIGSQVESLSWLIGAGFGSALVAFIGQNYGAGKQERIDRVVRLSARIMTVWGLFVMAFLWFAGRYVFALFLPAPEMMALGVPYLRILSFCQLAMNIEAVGSGAFKGTGRTVEPSIVVIATNAVKPVLAFLLSRTSLGLYGIWIGIVISANLRGIWMNIWYAAFRRKKF
jgi:putative MATE family efflux protein